MSEPAPVVEFREVTIKNGPRAGTTIRIPIRKPKAVKPAERAPASKAAAPAAGPAAPAAPAGAGVPAWLPVVGVVLVGLLVGVVVGRLARGSGPAGVQAEPAGGTVVQFPVASPG